MSFSLDLLFVFFYFDQYSRSNVTFLFWTVARKVKLISIQNDYFILFNYFNCYMNEDKYGGQIIAKNETSSKPFTVVLTRKLFIPDLTA